MLMRECSFLPVQSTGGDAHRCGNVPILHGTHRRTWGVAHAKRRAERMSRSRGRAWGASRVHVGGVGRCTRAVYPLSHIGGQWLRARACRFVKYELPVSFISGSGVGHYQDHWRPSHPLLPAMESSSKISKSVPAGQGRSSSPSLIS